MENLCYKMVISCNYANELGKCIYENAGVCEMLGDTMPDKLYPFGTVLYKYCDSYAGKSNYVLPLVVRKTYGKDGFGYIECFDSIAQTWTFQMDKLFENYVFRSKPEAERHIKTNLTI